MVDEVHEDLVVPPCVLVEVDYWTRKLLGSESWDVVVEDIASGAYRLEPLPLDARAPARRDRARPVGRAQPRSPSPTPLDRPAARAALSRGRRRAPASSSRGSRRREGRRASPPARRARSPPSAPGARAARPVA